MNFRNLFLLLTLAALWGGSFIFIRVSANVFSPIPLMGIRVILATFFLALVYFFYSKKQKIQWHSTKDIVIVGIINQALPFCLFAFAELSLTAGETAVLNSTTPMWTGMVAYLWFGTKLDYLKIFGITLGFVGIILLMRGKVSISDSDSDTTVAIFAVLFATFLYGISYNYTKARLAHISPLTLALGSMMSASVFLAPFTFMFWPTVEIESSQWLSVGLLGIASTGIAYIIFFHLIQTIGPSNASTVTFIIPVFGLFFGWLALGEEITYFRVMACLIIILGTMLATGFINMRTIDRIVAMRNNS